MPDRLHLRLLKISIWPTLAVILSLATISHDVVMAQHDHPTRIPPPAAQNIRNHAPDFNHHGHLQGPAQGINDARADNECPPEQCPALLDCAVARVISPHIDQDIAAPIDCPPAFALTSSGIELETYRQPPPGSAAIRRAQLQVFLI